MVLETGRTLLEQLRCLDVVLASCKQKLLFPYVRIPEVCLPGLDYRLTPQSSET